MGEERYKTDAEFWEIATNSYILIDLENAKEMRCEIAI